MYLVPIGPLQFTITWYKNRHAGEQTTHWDIQKQKNIKLSCFVLDVSVGSLLSSMAGFVPCDRKLQRAYKKAVCNVTIVVWLL